MCSIAQGILNVGNAALQSVLIKDSKAPNRHDGGLGGGLADEIMRLILNAGMLTIARMSDMLNISKRTVEREMKKLCESGRVVRKGGKRYGHWEIR